MERFVCSDLGGGGGRWELWGSDEAEMLWKCLGSFVPGEGRGAELPHKEH